VYPAETASREFVLTCFAPDPGTGKDAPSAQRSVYVDLLQTTHIFSGSGVSVNASPNAVAYMAAVNVLPGNSFSISGTAAANGNLTVALVGVTYTGSKEWYAVSNHLKDGGVHRAVSNTTTAFGGTWSVSFGGLPEAYYHLLIYDASYNLKGSGFLVSTWKG
jgi:hypothetical protein